MDKKIAKRWIKALRSGKYKQTKEVLQNKKGYCCLGVLCEISNKEVLRDHNGRLIGTDLDEQPYPVANLLGSSRWLIRNKPTNLNDNIPLDSLNDSWYQDDLGSFIHDPLNFNEIADVIQAVVIEGALDEPS